MGMYDMVRSSYNLGEQFTNVECQTKDIEYGYGGTLTDYWISPDGYLWYADYSDTADFVLYDENHPKYNLDLKFMNFEWVRNGNRGKCRVNPITKYVEIYPVKWKGGWETRPVCRIHFKYGKVVDFEYVTQ